MENYNYRSKSHRERDAKNMQIESYYGGGGGGAPPPQGPRSMHDMRSYSTSHATASSYSSVQLPQAYPYPQVGKEVLKFKKGKSSAGSTASKIWSLNTIMDSELQRKKRIAGYKVYTVERKMKGSLRKSFRWIKDTCTQVVHGWW